MEQIILLFSIMSQFYGEVLNLKVVKMESFTEVN